MKGSNIVLCGTFHAAGEALSHGFVELFRGHPTSQLADSAAQRCGHCVPLFLGHNHSLTLHTSNVPRVGPGQPAAGERLVKRQNDFSVAK